MPRRLVIATAALALLTAGCGSAGHPAASPSPSASLSPSSSTPAAPTTSASPSQVSVFVLGDSYVAGTAQNNGPPWQELMATDRHWALDWDGVGGTGYLMSSSYGPAYAHRLAADLARPIGRANPTFMVVAGGGNDHYLKVGRVAGAAMNLFVRIHQLIPRSRLVVISPWVPSPALYKPREDAALKRVALREHAVWIDSHRWFLDHPDLIGADHIHPTEAGHRFIAAQVGAVLAGLVAQPG